MNIAEILKYCPKGTKLYSTVFGEVTLDRIDIYEKYPILVYKLNGADTSFDEEGRYVKYYNSECVLFPSKDQRDWSKFRLPLKRGDIMMDANGECPFIATGEFKTDISPKYICGINSLGNFQLDYAEAGWTSIFYIPASKEAKKELFSKIAEAGYKWNANTLELEKIEPKFKEGDVVVDSDGDITLITKIEDSKIRTNAFLYTDDIFKIYDINIIYSVSNIRLASREERNKFYSALVREGYKYDKEQHKLIKQEFKPFDRVLVRDKDTDTWEADIYLGYNEEDKYYHYKCTRMNYQFCIPYEGNEYILGTTNYSA